MKVSPLVGAAIASTLAVGNWLQLEENNFGKPVHVIVGAASIFFVTFLKVEKT